MRVFCRTAPRSCSATELFVRRCPPQLGDWLRERPREADARLRRPCEVGVLLRAHSDGVLLALIGGGGMAAGYTGAVAFGSIVLAVRGRTGAGAFFPLRACLFAPLWVLERSVSVYWALLQKMRGTVVEQPAAVATQRSARAASGE